jgi:site-specific DNA recombinase
MPIAEPLWDRATHEALVQATAPECDGKRARRACGCSPGRRLHVERRGGPPHAYSCTARIRGIRASAGCKPAPSIALAAADALVSEWFLARYGSGEVMRKIYDPGTGHTAQIARA